jgi:hypothetical protein
MHSTYAMKTTTTPLIDLPQLWGHLDEEAGGALYALRYECKMNGWVPHLWAQTPKEGGPFGLTRVFLIGNDKTGRTKYFDSVLLRDTTWMAAKIKVSETVAATKGAARPKKRRLNPEAN